MDADKMNRWLALGANIGVLVGIVLLIVELGQNRAMVAAQTRHAISEQYVNFNYATLSDPEIADIIIRVVVGDDLSPQERLRYQFRNRAWFDIAQNSHYQYRQGLFDDDEYEALMYGWKEYANISPGVAEVWCLVRMGHSPDFRTVMDSMFDNLEC